MYRDEILDLYRKPRNEGSLETKHHAEGDNASCGDHTEIYLEIENGKVNKARHETDGCAICTAATSILTEEIEGLDKDEIRDLETDWIIDKLGIEISPMRTKCAVLGLKTAQKALEK